MKTVVLFSGGIDSTVALAMSLSIGRKCLALSFDYGQRHKVELKAAADIARHYKVQHKIIKIDPTVFGDTSLVSDVPMPKDRSTKEITSGAIPNTYVPARNTLFLAYAAGQAEIFDADEIVIGANMLDYHPYPDCRAEYFKKFQELLNIATKQAIDKKPPQVLTPLVSMTKIEIIRRGVAIKAPLHLTFTCYDPIKEIFPCQHCDACQLRNEAYHSILYQGEKQQFWRCKPTEGKDTSDATVDVNPFASKMH